GRKPHPPTSFRPRQACRLAYDIFDTTEARHVSHRKKTCDRFRASHRTRRIPSQLPLAKGLPNKLNEADWRATLQPPFSYRDADVNRLLVMQTSAVAV